MLTVSVEGESERFMNDNDLLKALKIDLQITSTGYDERLAQYLEGAKKEILREGYKLTDSIDDANLQVMYAAWMWRRRDTGEGMPRMIRWQLNNRLFDLEYASE